MSGSRGARDLPAGSERQQFSSCYLEIVFTAIIIAKILFLREKEISKRQRK